MAFTQDILHEGLEKSASGSAHLSAMAAPVPTCTSAPNSTSALNQTSNTNANVSTTKTVMGCDKKRLLIIVIIIAAVLIGYLLYRWRKNKQWQQNDANNEETIDSDDEDNSNGNNTAENDQRQQVPLPQGARGQYAPQQQPVRHVSWQRPGPDHPRPVRRARAPPAGAAYYPAPVGVAGGAGAGGGTISLSPKDLAQATVSSNEAEKIQK